MPSYLSQGRVPGGTPLYGIYTRYEHSQRVRLLAAVTSIVVEQGCFKTELRIAGNNNKLIYFRKAASRVYSTKPLHVKSISLTAETLAVIWDPYSQSSGRPRRPKYRTDDQNNLNTRPLDE